MESYKKKVLPKSARDSVSFTVTDNFEGFSINMQVKNRLDTKHLSYYDDESLD